MEAAGPATTISGTVEVGTGQVLAEPGPTSIGETESFGPTIEGGGTFATAGITTLAAQSDTGITDLTIGDGLTWINTGTVDEGGSVEFGLKSGDTDAIVNGDGATYDLTNDAGITESFLLTGATATFTNDGLLTKTGGTGAAAFNAAINSSGTVDVLAGTIAFGGGGDISGLIETAGTASVAFAAGTFTLADGATGANLVVDGGRLTLQTPTSLGGSVVESAGTLAVAANSTEEDSFTATSGIVAIGAGDTFTLRGAVTLGANEFSPDIAGPGTLATTGTVDIPAQSGGAIGVRIGDGLTWTNSGAVTVTTSIVYGLSSDDTSSVVNQAGGTLFFDGGAGLTAFLGINTSATLANAGLVAVASGTNTSTIAAATTNTGTIDVRRGTLALTGTVGGSGTIDIEAGATLRLSATSGQDVTFDGAANLVLEDPSSFAALGAPAAFASIADAASPADSISGLQGGDTITFVGDDLESAVLGGGTLAVTLTNGRVLDLAVSGPAGQGQISVSGDELTVAPCFAAGTSIATDRGPRPVETLGAGDTVLTVSGAAREIVWAGHRRGDSARQPAPELVRPVRRGAGAFGPAQPERDLVVSPDHNLFVDGVLIPAKCLVNNRNVAELDVPAVTYHHIELATHDVVLANNMPAETYLDTGNRANFSGGSATVAHPDFSSAPDLNWFTWVAEGYAKLVLAGPELDAVRARLASRADRRWAA